MANDDETFKNYVLELAKKDLRVDERKMDDYRQVKIETGVSKNAEGSAIVKLGNTEVIVGVKMKVGTPFPDRPEEGTIIVNAEFSPISNPNFEPGPPGEEAVECARVVDRGLREGDVVDLKKLMITAGEKVWMIFIDMYIINHDGNLIDACALAALAALMDAKFPKYENEKIDYNEHTEQLQIRHQPIATTFVNIGGYVFIDPSYKEEGIADDRITVTVNENGEINAMQKSGLAGMTEKELVRYVDMALQRNNELREKLIMK